MLQSYKFLAEEDSLHVSHVIYPAENGTLETFNHISVSSVKKHDATTVYISLKDLVKILKEKVPNLEKNVIVTDGAPGHYKNKFSFTILTFLLTDLSLAAEHHFHPTSHEKAQFDGIEGLMKCIVREEMYENMVIDDDEHFSPAQLKNQQLMKSSNSRIGRISL